MDKMMVSPEATTSREIDEAVAELIFDTEYEHEWQVPAYTRDWTHAMLVRDHVKSWGFSRRARFTTRLQELITADYPDIFVDGKTVIHPLEIFMHAQPRHVCVAALEALSEFEQ